ncbi:helix-turn-helix transcriptional regulator [bacterium]|nr:helix-turn-helix transcriptional regulator [bacterium]
MNLAGGFSIVRSRYNIKTIDMAKSTGKSIRSIQNIMAQGANPTIDSIMICCDAIGCTFEELAVEAQKCR